MSLTVKTNNQWRNFLYRSEVPKTVLADQFGHLSEDDSFDGFIKYRGNFYHTSDFMRFTADTDKNWQGYVSDSAFSGILLNFSRDGEQYQIATYFC